MQGFLRVCVSVTALADVVGLQLNAGLDGGDWLIAGLQTNAREQAKASCARLVLNPLIKTLKKSDTHKIRWVLKCCLFSGNFNNDKVLIMSSERAM